jgi:hypothetical protein
VGGLGIPTQRTEEIDPRNVSLPKSDDKVSCVGAVEVDEDMDEDILPLDVASRVSAPEIAKVSNQNSSPAFPD